MNSSYLYKYKTEIKTTKILHPQMCQNNSLVWTVSARFNNLKQFMNTFVQNQAIRIILNQLEISKFDGFDSPWQQSVENRFSDISFHNRSRYIDLGFPLTFICVLQTSEDTRFTYSIKGSWCYKESFLKLKIILF